MQVPRWNCAFLPPPPSRHRARSCDRTSTSSVLFWSEPDSCLSFLEEHRNGRTVSRRCSTTNMGKIASLPTASVSFQLGTRRDCGHARLLCHLLVTMASAVHALDPNKRLTQYMHNA